MLETQFFAYFWHIMDSATYYFTMNVKQYSFAELSKKTVINVADGKELGSVCDLIFNGCGNVLGIVVPGKKSLLRSITSADNIYIRWNRIMKIGADVILVELVGGVACACANNDQVSVAEDASPQQELPPT